MAVGPVRALLTAHLQAGWNRSMKELGKGGTVALVMALTALILLAVIPVLVGATMLGYLAGTGAARPYAPMALGLLMTSGAFGGGLVCGVAGGARALEWERYRAFPLPLRTLFLAELLAGAGDLLPMLLLLAMGGVGVGMAVALPKQILLVAMLVGSSAVILLSTQHLVGALAGLLVKRLRVGLVVLGSLAWVISAMAPVWLPGKASQRAPSRLMEPHRPKAEVPAEALSKVEAGAKVLAKVATWLPHGQAAEGLKDAAEGRWGSAWLRQAYLLGVALALAALAARALAWETSPQTQRPMEKGPAPRLWSFHRPVVGLGRLAWETLLGSHLGKFGFLVPLMTLVLLKGPFAHFKGQDLWGLPGAFAYLSLTGSQMLFNQFGLYHHGIKTLLLLPVSSRQLLQGQVLGLGIYLGLQALILVFLLGLISQPSPVELAAGLCLGACFFFVQASVGLFTSVAMPRTMPRDSLKSGGIPFLMVVVSLGTTLGCSVVFGGAYGLCAWLAPGWLLGVMLALAVMCGLAFWLILPLAAEFLREKREKLVEVLSG